MNAAIYVKRMEVIAKEYAQPISIKIQCFGKSQTVRFFNFHFNIVVLIL